jgi:hypothetical protein
MRTREGQKKGKSGKIQRKRRPIMAHPYFATLL